MRTYGRILTTLACGLCLAGSVPAAKAQKGSDAQIQADAQKQLSGKRFSGIQVQVQGGVVHLTGQVDRYADKADAEKRINKMHEASSVRDDINVAGGGSVSDEQLYQKLAKALLYVRQGYESYPFDSFTLQVHNGVVTVGGLAAEPVDKDDALAVVQNAPGVRDVIDKIQVAPVSPNDWRIRRDLYRAIYGYPSFTKYAINPAKPIRIVVVNGHAVLTGVVDSQADKELAGMRANQVAGVFSVQNDLQVAGQNEH
jgi:osmotically-inducible protein OsmY